MDKYNSLVTMDPGKRKFGVACFFEGHLHSVVGIVEKDTDSDKPIWHQSGIRARTSARSMCVANQADTTFAVEQMEVRKGRLDAGRALIHLSLMSGVALADWQGRVEMVSPRSWTGTMRKKNHQRRTLTRLDPDEEMVYNKACEICPASAKSEIIDAIGIGLYLLGRTR